MRKSESIFHLQSLGLNTLDCFITRDFRQAKAYLENHLDDKMSIRTERRDEFLCPFYYGQPGRNLITIAKERTDEGYLLLIYHYLDWRDSIAYGSIGLPKDGTTIVEFVDEPGLVRDLYSHQKRISLILRPGLAMVPNNLWLNTIIREVQECCYSESSCVVEWSLYKYPVGILQKPVIYWELRDYA